MQTTFHEHVPWSHRLETGPAECAERLNNINKNTNNTNNNTNTTTSTTTTTGGLLEVVSCLPAGRGASSAPENSTLNKETREKTHFMILIEK